MKKLAAKGGVMDFQIGNEFQIPRCSSGARAKQARCSRTPPRSGVGPLPASLEEIDRKLAGSYSKRDIVAPEQLKMSVDDWVGVVDCTIELAGEDHVALGSDFEGGPMPPRGMRDIAALPMITEAMLRRGYSEQRFRKFLRENLLRVGR